MLKVRISKDGITRSYHLESKTAEYFNADGEFKGTFDIENELEGLKEIINANIGCTIDMIEEEKTINIDMSNINLEYAMNKTKEFYDKVEERKNSNTKIKSIPVNELGVYKIAKEMKEKLDK